MRPGQLTPENLNIAPNSEIGHAASMRPGQLTPENRNGAVRASSSHQASMRPGQLTPENVVAEGVAQPAGASMRPGQLTPENEQRFHAIFVAEPGFNEAGAINPGKRRRLQFLAEHLREASMRPGQLTPENGDVYNFSPNIYGKLQ